MSTITKSCLSEIEKIKKICRDLNVTEYTFSPFIFPASDGNQAPLKYRLNDSELHQYYKFSRLTPDCDQVINNAPVTDETFMNCGATLLRGCRLI